MMLSPAAAEPDLATWIAMRCIAHRVVQCDAIENGYSTRC